MANQKWEEIDIQFNQQILACKDAVHKHLLNNINTPGIIQSMDDLIKLVNIYIDKAEIKTTLLIKAGSYIAETFDIMKLEYWKLKYAECSPVERLLNLTCDFRDFIRLTISKKDYAAWALKAE